MTRSAFGLCVVTLACGALASAGCGDDDGDADPAQAGTGGGGTRDGGPAAAAGEGGRTGEGGGTLRAVIDGRDWEATAETARAEVDEDIPGGYAIEGESGASELRFSFYYVDAPGTYAFGVGGTVVGAQGSYAQPSMIWQTPGSGAAGELVVMELSAERIAGTFEFDLVPVPGSSATGMRAITEGEFDLPLEGTVRPIGADHGRSLSAEFNGELFNAATVVVTPVAGGIFFNALNDAYNMGFSFMGVDEPGTYELALQQTPARTVVVVASDPADEDRCCWGASPEDSGSLTLTTLSEDRLVGTFEFTLAAQADSGASAPLVVTQGVFDIGRGDP